MIRIARASGSWQVILADLALILFVVMLAGFVAARGVVARPDDGIAVEPGQAVYRKTLRGPSLGDWLDSEISDPRAQLTIHARYQAEDRNAVVQEALELWGDAVRDGHHPRLIVETGARSGVVARLAYDRKILDKDESR